LFEILGELIGTYLYGRKLPIYPSVKLAGVVSAVAGGRPAIVSLA
jgi:hypothetical protein